MRTQPEGEGPSIVDGIKLSWAQGMMFIEPRFNDSEQWTRYNMHLAAT